jgi:hypothetical protein
MGLGGLRCCEGSRPDHRCNALSTDSRINVGWTYISYGRAPKFPFQIPATSRCSA